MTIVLGPTLADEARAALGVQDLPFTYDEAGGVYGRENLTVGQNAVLDAVIAAHDPEKVPAPTRVSRRQFKMQLSKAGLTAAVETWVAQQPELVQIAFADSGEFDRTEPMMQQGFASMGFTAAQIEAFFTAASLL